MLQIVEKKADFSAKDAAQFAHALVLMPAGKSLPDVPGKAGLNAALKRRDMKVEELAKSPVAVEHDGRLTVFAMVDGGKPAFDRHTQLRKAWECLAAEKPESLAVAISGDSCAAFCITCV